MTDRTDEIIAPFVQRLRDDLLDNLPRHRQRRRRRRRAALGASATAVLVAAVLVAGPGGPGDPDRDADVATVSTTVPPDQPQVSPPVEPSVHVVEQFLDDVQRGDLEAAAQLWSGYPGTDELAARVEAIEEMLVEVPWLADPAYSDHRFEAPLWPGDHQAVTVTASPGPDRARKAAAFVLDRGPRDNGVDPLIERLPSHNAAVKPDNGWPVIRSQAVTVMTSLVEDDPQTTDDVVAWFDGHKVPVQLSEDPNANLGLLTTHVPDPTIDETVLTVLVTDPDVPAPVAFAYWFPLYNGTGTND
jgi:hypothetical protein